MFDIPVILICFNRANHTQRVLEKIVAQQPKHLYVFRDHWRDNIEGEKEKCDEVLLVIKKTLENYNINLHLLLPETNLGCGAGPMTALNWFFSENEMGIILEDDCIPHPDFFGYCDELLERYKNDERIAMIGGSNYGSISSDASYSFCCGHMTTWGWATWRRVWKLYDYKLNSIDSNLFSKLLKRYNNTWKQREYWWYIWGLVKKDQMNDSCWDYQFYWSFWKYGMVAICPAVNMITNVGIGDDATHPMSTNGIMQRPIKGILPLTHPSTIKLNKEYDEYLMRRWINTYDYGWSGFKRLPYLLNRWIKRLVGHEGSWFRKRQR